MNESRLHILTLSETMIRGKGDWQVVGKERYKSVGAQQNLVWQHFLGELTECMLEQNEMSG